MSDPVKEWPGEELARDKTVREPGEGSAWIQWKGTQVCMDVHCRCGEHGHVDVDFAYFYRCGGCGEVFSVGQVVRLYPMTPELQASHGERAVGTTDEYRELHHDARDEIRQLLANHDVAVAIPEDERLVIRDAFLEGRDVTAIAMLIQAVRS